MTVFKTFLKVVKANKTIILLYSIILVVFGTINMQTSNNNVNFTAEKPHVLIINKDENKKITQGLVDYISNNSEIVNIKDNEDSINDALFYRDVNYVIYIPEGYSNDILNGNNPTISVKSTNNIESNLAELLLNRYVSTINIYKDLYKDEDLLVEKTTETLNKTIKTEVVSKVDKVEISNATFYYNFMNYSLLAGCVYVICLVLSSFREENIKKRTTISSINYKKYNTQLLLSNGLLIFILWLIYVLISFIILKDFMLTSYGLVYIINSFIFGICSLTIGFLIANITSNKNAINGIVNVVALGSSFLCGGFVPMEVLPESVLKVAHILPSYWFIKSNELLKEIEVINFDTLKPILGNMLIVILFSILFIILTNIISNKKRTTNG